MGETPKSFFSSVNINININILGQNKKFSWNALILSTLLDALYICLKFFIFLFTLFIILFLIKINSSYWFQNFWYNSYIHKIHFHINILVLTFFYYIFNFIFCIKELFNSFFIFNIIIRKRKNFFSFWRFINVIYIIKLILVISFFITDNKCII